VAYAVAAARTAAVTAVQIAGVLDWVMETVEPRTETLLLIDSVVAVEETNYN